MLQIEKLQQTQQVMMTTKVKMTTLTSHYDN